MASIYTTGPLDGQSSSSPPSALSGDAIATGDVVVLTQEELTQQISHLTSPDKIAAFIMDMNCKLQKLQDNNTRLRDEVMDLREVNTGLSNQVTGLSALNDELAAEVVASRAPGTSFTCFKKLPPELKVRVWKFAMPEPRMVVVECNVGRNKDQLSCYTNRHPTILHVNQEARAEVLKMHPLCPEQPAGIPRFFNHTRDTLYIDNIILQVAHWGDPKHGGKGWNWDGSKDAEGNIVCPAGFDVSRIRSVAIDSATWDDHHLVVVYALFKYPMLEELTIMDNTFVYFKGKVVELDDYDDVFRKETAGLEPILNAYEYQAEVEKVFESEFDENIFFEQWREPLHGMQGRGMRTVPSRNLRKNLWLSTGRKTPLIRMMRLESNKEVIFDFESE